MKYRIQMMRIFLFVAIFALIGPPLAYGDNHDYSSATYDGWKRFSQYVAVRDGTELAVDYYRPTKNDKLHDEKLPVVWSHTAYHRYKLDQAGQVPQANAKNLPSGAELLLRHGYVIAVVDVRGMGASFGSQVNWLGTQQTRDSYDITEWLARQNWSDGNIGMFGRSYLGTVQYFAAAGGSSHLKAIFPEMAGFDNYNIFYSNGIYRADMPAMWRTMTAKLNYSLPTNHVNPFAPRSMPPMSVAPVDDDPNGEKLLSAVREHFVNRDLVDMQVRLPFRDDVDTRSGLQVHKDDSPWTLLHDIEQSNVAIYHVAGWFDAYAKDTLLYFNNLSNPQKVLVGPWHHGHSFGFDLPTERLRWFDYWLKSIDNSIMDGPAMTYFVPGAEIGTAWRNTDQWPLASERRVPFYFSKMGDEGRLSTDIPVNRKGKDQYQVDFGVTLGPFAARNTGTNPACFQTPLVDPSCGQRAEYPDLQAYDARSLTYTSAPFSEDTEMIGHPVIHLWATADTDDAEFFVVMEEIHADGFSQYLSDGAVLASHRTVNDPPFNHLNMPWLGNYRADASIFPDDEPVALEFDLRPISNVVKKGNRIRVTIAGAEANYVTAASSEQAPPILSIFRNSNYSSYIELPFAGTTHPE